MDAGQLYADAKVNEMSLSKLSVVRGLRGLCVLSLMVVMTTLADALPDPVAAGWQGRSVCEVLREDDQVRIFRCVFPPGVGHERHFHPRHFGYALSGGTMRITSGAVKLQTYLLKMLIVWFLEVMEIRWYLLAD